jgi:hypothetical protein
MTSWKLSRRAMLRGAGVALALPVLDAMLDDRGLLHGTAHAQSAAPPVRVVTFFFPNGTWNKLNYPGGVRTLESIWVPSATGTGYPLPPALMPLAALRDEFNVVSGLNNVEGNGHEIGMPTFANGAAPSGETAGGPSIDQVALDHLGGGTRVSSLVISLSGNCNMNRPRQRALSWRSTAAGISHVQWESDPRSLFRTLFGASAPAAMPGQPADPTDALRRSVLDFVRGDAQRLRGRLGANDRSRLDEHLAAIREIEARLGGGGGGGNPPPASCAMVPLPAAIASGPTGAVCATGTNPWRDDVAAPIMADLLALALKCDLTRFASFGLGDTNYDVIVDWIAPGKNEHNDIAHSATDRENVTRSTQWKMSVFAHLLTALRDSREGAGSVLDNCVIFCGSNMSDGQLHNHEDMPILVAGRAGGRLRTGRHVRYPGAMTRDLLGSLLGYAGVPPSARPPTLAGTLPGDF